MLLFYLINIVSLPVGSLVVLT